MNLRLLAALTLMSMVTACAQGPSPLQITEKGRPFTELDQSILGEAKPASGAVDSARIARAANEPQNWLTYYGGYHAQRYSRLDQINRGNVKNLRPAWVFQAGVIGLVASPATYTFEPTPFVVHSTMILFRGA